MVDTFINPLGDYPLHIGDVLLNHPDWDGTLEKLPEGWHPVFDTPLPVIVEGEYITEGSPALDDDGRYFKVWEVHTLTPEEIEKAKIAFIETRFRMSGLTYSDLEVLLASRDESML